MATSTAQDNRATARDLGLLARYIKGRTLRRWYLRKLAEHHLVSAEAETKLACQHLDAAKWFRNLACAALAELDRAEA